MHFIRARVHKAVEICWNSHNSNHVLLAVHMGIV